MAGNALSTRDVTRLAKVVRLAERKPRSGGIGPRSNNRNPTIRPASFAVITTTCTARSGAAPTFTLGQGIATLLWIDGGVMSVASAGQTIYNALKTSIPAGAGLVKLAWVDGVWVVDLADC